MHLTILIPALNEEKTIGQVIESLPRNLSGINKLSILIIDDGSADKTSEIAKSKGATVIRHKSNKGLGKAFHSGLEYSIRNQTDILLTMDADNQFDSSEIPKLIQPILDHQADFVTGSRFIDKEYAPENMPAVKKWGNFLVAKIISWGTKKKLSDVSCGFRAYSKEAMLHLNLFGKFTYTQETILEMAYKGLEIKEVPVKVVYFSDRKSRIAHSILGYGFRSGKIILRTIKDYRPLKFFGLCGAFLFLLASALNIFVIQHFFKTGTFSPYKIFGFMGAFLTAVSIMIVFIGILADLLDKIRLNQEKMLYIEKNKFYQNSTPSTDPSPELREHQSPLRQNLETPEHQITKPSL